MHVIVCTTSIVCMQMLFMHICECYDNASQSNPSHSQHGDTESHSKRNWNLQIDGCMWIDLKIENLVDPASSHMLVSKIKPCKCLYRMFHIETANSSLIQLSKTWFPHITWIPTVMLQLIHDIRLNLSERLLLLVQYQHGPARFLLNHNDWMDYIAIAFCTPLMFLTYQPRTVGHLPTMATTGDGGLGFDSGEGAREIATTSKEGSRRANYPILTHGGSDKK